MSIFYLPVIIVIAFVVLFLGKILSFLSKFVYYGLLVALVLVFLFGISLTEVLNLLTALLLWTF